MLNWFKAFGIAIFVFFLMNGALLGISWAVQSLRALAHHYPLTWLVISLGFIGYLAILFHSDLADLQGLDDDDSL